MTPEAHRTAILHAAQMFVDACAAAEDDKLKVAVELDISADRHRLWIYVMQVLCEQNVVAQATTPRRK